MTLTTHAIVGTAAASIFPAYPVAAFMAAFGSHFLVDAIPHWHYPVGSFTVDKSDPMQNDMLINSQFRYDFAKIALDAVLGLLLSYLVFHQILHLSNVTVLFGVAGGIVPDALQFVYWKWRHEPLKTLQRFHIWVHTRTDLDDQHLMGASLQVLLMAAATLFTRIL